MPSFFLVESQRHFHVLTLLAFSGIQKSPVDAKFSTSIEAAPSFSLFNQSFDSFGDGHYFNVDSSLHNDSFGIARVASVDQDATAQILQSTSAGNFSQQLLASGSGALTLPGYSPVNSFGNVSASVPRRTGSMMVVGGGSDNRASSPTQVLNVYRSYSSGGPRSGPLDDSHLRMSVGSFGTPSMAYSKSYGEVPPTASPGFYSGAAPPQDGPGSPPFYVFLRKHKNAFKDCLFLLPCLKDALQESSLDTEIDEGERSSSARHSKFDQRVSFLFTSLELSLFIFFLIYMFFITGRPDPSRYCRGEKTSRVFYFRLWWKPKSQQSLSATGQEFHFP